MRKFCEDLLGITRPVLAAELERLRTAWNTGGNVPAIKDVSTEILAEILGPTRLAEIDPFDIAQLRVCQEIIVARWRRSFGRWQGASEAHTRCGL